MNHKLAESYIKSRLRKRYRGKRVFCENGIAYIAFDAEINFLTSCITIIGYRTFNTMILDYPQKDDYLVDTLETIVSVIVAFANLEEAYNTYKEVI